MDKIKVTIDGKELIAEKGQTILQIARDNNIEIPTLCYIDEVKAYGACGLCVVEAENIPKLLRACATIASDGMVIRTDTPRVRQSRKIALELLISDHTGDCKGPCSLNCPERTVRAMSSLLQRVNSGKRSSLLRTEFLFRLQSAEFVRTRARLPAAESLLKSRFQSLFSRALPLMRI